jgi:hypothetical protein
MFGFDLYVDVLNIRVTNTVMEVLYINLSERSEPAILAKRNNRFVCVCNHSFTNNTMPLANS